MPASSMTEFDELINETEIVFTATPEFDEHFNSIPQTASPLVTAKPMPKPKPVLGKTDGESEHDKALEQDAVAKEQVDRLKAKLESHQQLRSGSDATAKQLRFKQLISETRGLNKESEKFNTQSAVLLSALTGLRNDFEESEHNKDSVVAELTRISKDAQGLLHDLKLSKADADESHTLSLASQQSSEKLINELDLLTKESLSQQQTGTALLQVLQTDIEAISKKKTVADDNSNKISEIVNSSNKLLEQASIANKQASARSGELETAIELHQVAKTEGESLIKSLGELKLELQQEKGAQEHLNQQSKAQIQKTEKLNEQQTTLIELTQSRHEELGNSLSNSLETVKKYQSKLQQTETKLKDAEDLQARYKEQYTEALSKLESNEALLRNAAKALVETNGQNGKFNASISKFQHATEQSQQLVIRTQTTLESILTRNQLLERENKLLAQKLNSFTAPAAPQKASPAAPSNMGFGTFNEMNFTDPQSGPQAPLDNKNGFFKLMVVLAIVIPLSFIAYSLFNSASAQQSNAPEPSLGTQSTEPTRSILLNNSGS